MKGGKREENLSFFPDLLIRSLSFNAFQYIYGICIERETNNQERIAKSLLYIVYVNKGTLSSRFGTSFTRFLQTCHNCTLVCTIQLVELQTKRINKDLCSRAHSFSIHFIKRIEIEMFFSDYTFVRACVGYLSATGK